MFNIHYPNVTGKILPVQKLYYAGTKGYETGYPKRQYTNTGYPFKIVFRRCQTQYWRRNNYFYFVCYWMACLGFAQRRASPLTKAKT